VHLIVILLNNIFLRSSDNMAWKCTMCKKTIELDMSRVGIKCPFCDGRTFTKERPTIAKRISTE
jgi:DNA-directed RNA polymerase subunit RPC12/RpoP